MNHYFLFGMNLPTLEECRTHLEERLGITFSERHSDVLGDPYYSCKADGSTFTLRENLDVDDGEPAELDFPQYNFILYADGIGEDDRRYERLLKLTEYGSVELCRHTVI